MKIMPTHIPRKRFHIPAKKQVGAFMLEMGFALIIAALAAAATIRTNVQSSRMQFASFQGDSMENLRAALNVYTSEHFAQLQFGQPITKNGVTLANGVAAGQTFNPTIANLVAMGYLNPGFTAQSSFSNGAAPGNYAIQMQLTPAGCVPNLCDITGVVYVDQPINAAGAAEPDGPAMSAIASRMGGNGGFSVMGSAGQITGIDGAWTAVNPVPGTPAGIVAGRFGTTSSGLGIFVRINDTRDPNLLGELTVAGRIASTTAVGTSDGAAACLRAAMQSDGQFLARAPDCVIRAFMNPNNGTIGVNNATGTNTVLLDGTTGAVTALAVNATTVNATTVNATNVATDTLTATGAATLGTALINTSSSPGVLCATEGTLVRDLSSPTAGLLICRAGVYVTLANASGTGTPNTACTEDGRIVKDVSNSSTRLLVCRGGFYRSVGLLTVTAGSACTVNGTDGQLAESEIGQGLICRNGVWSQLGTGLGKMAFEDAYIRSNGETVAMPACAAGGTPKVYLVPRAIDAIGYVNHFAVVSGTNWIVHIEDGQGAAKFGSVIAETYCYYGV